MTTSMLASTTVLPGHEHPELGSWPAPCCIGRATRRTHPNEHASWSHAKSRCHNPRDKKYPDYGARGIVMCEAWRTNFTQFVIHVGERPSRGHTLDRIDPNKGYECGACSDCTRRGTTILNVRWATLVEQNNNQRRTRYMEWNGQRMPVAEVRKLHGVSAQTFRNRISMYKWSIERAATEPPR